MKKLLNIDYKYYEILIIILLCGAIAFPPLLHVTNSNYYFMSDIITFFVPFEWVQYSLVIISIILVMLDIFLLVTKKIKFEFTKYEILLTIMLICGILSTVLTENISLAIWGTAGRLEGLVTLFSYYILFWNASLLKDMKYKKALLVFLVAFNLIQVFFSFVAMTGKINVFTAGLPASGFVGNQNFFATVTVLCSGLLAGCFYFARELKNRLFYLVILGIYLIALLATSTMSAVFGLGIMVILFFVYLFCTRKERTYKDNSKLSSWNIMVFFIVIAIIGFFAINAYMNNGIIDQIFVIIDELITIIKTGEIDESFGSGRFTVWANAIRLIPYYPIFGFGVDSFGPYYYANFGLSSGVYFDKVHNEYLQIILTEGIPCFLAYMTFYYFVIKDALRKCMSIYYNEENNEKYEGIYVGLFLAIIGYLAQAVFNISTINVAPNFWIIMGIACGGYIKVHHKEVFDTPKFIPLPNGQVAKIDGREYYE